MQYRLTPETLVPPPVKSQPRIRHIAGPQQSAEACKVQEGPLLLRWRGRDAVPRFGQGATGPQLEQFRSRIAALEDSGCVAQGGASRILNSLASSLALPSRQIYQARYGTCARSAAFDLDSSFRLKAVSPLLAPGVTELKVETVIPDQPSPIQVKMSPGLEGYEISYYELQPAAGGGVRVALVSVEQTRQGQTVAVAKPAGFAVDVPADARHVQLLFMRAETGAIRDIMLLTAPSYSALNAARRRVEASSDTTGACRAEREASCLPVPRLSAITAELRVTVKGKPVYVALGGTVSEALGEAGLGKWDERRAVATRLRVLRPWHDRLIPVALSAPPETLLGLVLIGGEQIEW